MTDAHHLHQDLKGVHGRIDRVEERVDDHAKKLGKVAEDTAWIKGYLQKHEPLPNGRAFQRDVGIVAGGGGIVGVVLWLLEQYFNSGGGS